MSGPLINRSLTTLRTELEFLRDSEIITEDLYEKINQSLPTKYEKGMTAWGVEKLEGGAQKDRKGVASDEVVEKMSQMSINRVPPPAGPPAAGPPVLEYCRSLYDYHSQEPGDLVLSRDDKIAVTEHLSNDWWKGYKQNTSPSDAGVFPSNYVTGISPQEFEGSPSKVNEKASYNPSVSSSQFASPNVPPPQYNAPSPQHLSAQPSYGGYAQYPPSSTNYYPPQQYNQAPVAAAPPPQPEPVQASSGGHDHFKKFGSKLGNAAIFGAGATIGSDIVNSIF